MQITHELHNNNLTIKFNNFKCNINLDGFSLANRHSWGCSFENNETVKKFLSSSSTPLYNVTSNINENNNVFVLYIKNQNNGLIYELCISKNVNTYDMILFDPDELEFGFYDIPENECSFSELFY